MGVIDVSAKAKLLVAEHGAEALLVADLQALEDFLCGDAAASATWEEVSDAVRVLLNDDVSAFVPPPLGSYGRPVRRCPARHAS